MTWMRSRMWLSLSPLPFLLSGMLLCLVLGSPPEVFASKDSVERGRKIFNSQICRDCHRMQGRGGLAAPDLTELWKKGKTREYVIQHLQNPRRFDAFTIMPSFNFSKEEGEALADYLLSPK